MVMFQPDGIEEFAAAHTTPTPELLEQLAAETRERFGEQAGMLSGQLVGTLLQTLIVATSAKRVLEIGTFTGASALFMAAALPDDGTVTTCDINPKSLALARSYFARSPHGRKVEVREGPALETLATLTAPFEVIFIDADKGNYINYYEAALPLLAPHGVIAADNVLWSGRVLDPKEPDDRAIVAFDAHVQADPRVRQVITTVRDGVMLITRA